MRVILLRCTEIDKMFLASFLFHNYWVVVVKDIAIGAVGLGFDPKPIKFSFLFILRTNLLLMAVTKILMLRDHVTYSRSDSLFTIIAIIRLVSSMLTSQT